MAVLGGFGSWLKKRTVEPVADALGLPVSKVSPTDVLKWGGEAALLYFNPVAGTAAISADASISTAKQNQIEAQRAQDAALAAADRTRPLDPTAAPGRVNRSANIQALYRKLAGIRSKGAALPGSTLGTTGTLGIGGTV